jgi:PTH2 family peptidyl-tRNA hydrolase
MGKGKIASQCSHAALKAYRMLSSSEKGSSEKARKYRVIKTLWEGSGEKIVVCRSDGGQEQLEGILDQAKRRGVLSGTIRDAGRTQVEPGSLTILFVGPDRESVVDSFTGHLKLL